MKRQRSLSEAVLISFGSTNSFPKMLKRWRASASQQQVICCTVSVSILQNLQNGSPLNRPIIRRCPLTGASPVRIATAIFSWCLPNLTLWRRNFFLNFSTPCIQGVAGGKVNILGGYSIGHSKQKTLYEHLSYSERFPRYNHFNANRKIVDKKELLRVRTVSNTGIYCSSDRVGTVYNKCSKIPHIHMLQTVAQQGRREGQYWAPKQTTI